MFLSKEEIKNHEANIGLNFHFQDIVSEEVLRNYLSRSTTTMMYFTENSRFDEILRMLLYTGAKYIARADIAWEANGAEYASYPIIKEKIAYAHELDPDLVFEACIFETTSKKVEEIPIPAWVFEAFDLPAENRSFRYDKMIYPSGDFLNLWNIDFSVPDITQTETQMFFYYRACTYIDLGFEGLHMGQIYLIGKYDTDWKCYHKMLSMVREYAKKHARRGFVFINGHTHGMNGPDGKLLFDFHAWPYRGVAPKGSIPHPPTETNPQEIELRIGHLDSLYKRSLGGETYSGWSCDSLPYFVELDNCYGYGDRAAMDQPIEDSTNHWGGDEISWFANQPRWYRHQWLDYAYWWIRENDPAGYGEMPGNRTAAMRFINGNMLQQIYYCNSSKHLYEGFDDEECIRQIWINDRKSRDAQ